MKLTYSKIDEDNPQIEIDTKINLNAQANEKDEEEIERINKIHQIIEVYANVFHIKLKECSYDMNSENSKSVEFHISTYGSPHLATMMIIAAHGAIIKHNEIELDAFYGTIRVHTGDNKVYLVFNAVTNETLDVVKH